MSPSERRSRRAGTIRSGSGILSRARAHQMAPGLDRYMVFNAGRYDAYARWYGTPRAFNHAPATASAVGVQGADLSIFCLAAQTPGTPIENPRQTPSWRYSTRYGPKPPCFARATVVSYARRAPAPHRRDRKHRRRRFHTRRRSGRPGRGDRRQPECAYCRRHGRDRDRRAALTPIAGPEGKRGGSHPDPAEGPRSDSMTSAA